MNPNSGEQGTSPFKFEQPLEGQERQRERAMEQKPVVTESAPTKHAPKTLDPAQTMQLPVPAIDVGQQIAGTPAPVSDAKTKDLSAHEAELIEKEWVHRAKTIVNQTQDDPYIQKKEISKAGADYIKKRFNKTIPSDDAAIA